MAFTSKSEKPAFIPAKEDYLGPGRYNVSAPTKINRAYAPFLSATHKNNRKNQEDLAPGPGYYDMPSAFDKANKKPRVYYSTLGQYHAASETANMSTIFKSKAQRFETSDKNNLPGPGAYYNQQENEKRRHSAIAYTPHTNAVVEKIMEQNRKAIPSIPGHKSSYGYTEVDRNTVVPNMNPLSELQQYVGPGYYQAQDFIGKARNKGISWKKSVVKRFDKKLTTNEHIGPGTYELNPGIVVPSKNKPSAVFVSVSQREDFSNQKAKQRSMSVQPQHSQRSSISYRFTTDMSKSIARPFLPPEDFEALQEVEDRPPGPGQYHREELFSSIKKETRPPRLQFFGSSTERFKENVEQHPGTADTVEFELKSRPVPGKKEGKKVPFAVSGPRFEKNVHEGGTGPGNYEIKGSLVDRVKEKEKMGYIGSFGTTDRRFKEKPPVSSEFIGPGAYDISEEVPIKPETGSKAEKPEGHIFQSKTKREIIQMKKDVIPPPGSYDTGYYDLSRRASAADKPKKVPFNIISKRFREEKAVTETSLPYGQEEISKLFEEKKRSVSVDKRLRDRMNAVFLSQTKKATEVKKVEESPGPGNYTAGLGKEWVKKTYNVNYMAS